MIYDYRYLNDELVRIQNLGIDGLEVKEEDIISKPILDESVQALKNFMDADIFNENSDLGKKLKDNIINNYQKLLQHKTRIDKIGN